jgi:succinate-acetate transporter protein
MPPAAQDRSIGGGYKPLAQGGATVADQLQTMRTHSDPTRAVPPPPDATSISIADPAALGLAGFAMTTFVLSMFNTGLVSKAGEPVVLGLALAYGGGAQLLAGMWEFRKGNTFGATAFSSYGAFWISYWAFVAFFAKGVPDTAVGLYLIAWGIFTFYMWVASFRTTVAVNVVLLLLWITFLLLGIGDASANGGITKLGGWIGLATALAAWYASFAIVANFTFKRTIFPVRELRRA